MDIEKIIWAESFHEEERVAGQQWEGSVPIEFYESPLHVISRAGIEGNVLASIRTHSDLDSSGMDQVRGIVTRSTGYDHILDSGFSGPVGYLPDYATGAVADHNFTVAMALFRQILGAMSAIQYFDRNQLTGRELVGRTVGIVGVGRIGKATAERFIDRDSQVIGHDIQPDPDWARRVGFEYVELGGIFERSELTILCLPRTTKTEGLITRKHLNSMPEGSYLVNSGRGEVVSNRHLLEALEEGPVEGMGLDVFNREGEIADVLRNPANRSGDPDREVLAGIELIEHDRVIATPHNAFNTEEALERKVRDSLNSLEQFLRDGSFLNPVPGRDG